MEVGGRQEIELDYEALGDINQFSEDANAENKDGFDVNVHSPELHESTEPERNRKCRRYNLRKSLAWDSAFFTSAGVLDPEELSSMMTGADKSEKTSLSGIQEEVNGSTESLSTLASDSLTLEACEDDLFLDIRASIQRSSKRASHLMNSSSKKAAMDIDNTSISSLKKEESVPQDKNPKPGLKKTSGLQAVRMSKCQPKLIGKLGSSKSIKQDSVQSQVTSVAKVGGTKLTLPRAPKTIISSIPLSTASAKRESTGTVRLKSESSSKLGTSFGKGTQPSKISALSGSRNMLPKTAVPLKSSLLGSSTTTSVHSTRSSTSSDSSTNTSSGIPAKSTLMTARRNIGKTSNVGPPASISKIPSRVPLRAAPSNKLPASSLSAYVKSSKISSNISPASSISEWSSASSSSSMANQRTSCNSRTSLDTSSCTSLDGAPTAEKHEKQGVLLASNASKKSSTQTIALQAPAKPSGLRMPSPSIGFFDGMKSPARTPNGQKQSESSLRAVFSKKGNTASIPIQSSNSKLKSPRVSIAKTVSSLANIKPASPFSTQEKLHASIVPKDVNDSSNLYFGAKDSATKDGFKQVMGAGNSAIDEENFGDSSMCKNAYSEDNIRTFSGSEYVGQIRNNILINQDHLKESESHPICEAGDDDIKTVSSFEYVDQMGDTAPVNQNRLVKDSKSHPNCEAGDDKIVSGSEYVDHMGDNILNNQYLLEKDSEPLPSCEAEDDIKTVSSSEYTDQIEDNVLLSQDHLKKDSELRPICEAIKIVSVSECIDQMEDNVLINHDHLEKDSKSHPICEAGNDEITVSISEYVDQMGDNAPVSGSEDVDQSVNQNHLEKDSKSHPICEAGDDIKTASGSESVDQMGHNIPINQDHLEKASELHQIYEAIKIIPVSNYFDHMEDSVLIKQDHLEKDSESRPICEAGNDVKTVSGSENVDHMRDNVLINQDHLEKESELHPICETGDDVKTVSGSEIIDQMGDDALVNQDHLEKDSKSHLICEAGDDDIKTVSVSESVVQMEDSVLINQDHLEKESELHPICETGDRFETVSGSEIVDQMGDIALANQDHLEKDCESHPICEAGDDDIKTVSVSESVDQMEDVVLINQELLEKKSELRPTCEAGDDDIKTVSSSEHGDQMRYNAPVNEDHLDKDFESHPICESGDDIKTVSGSESVDHIHMGDNIPINMDHLEIDSVSHPISEAGDDISIASGSESVDHMGDNVLINGDHPEELELELHLICEAMENLKIGSGPEHVDHVGDNVPNNGDHLRKDSESYPICDAGHNIKTDSGSEYVDQMTDNVPINGDNDSNSHPIDKENDRRGVHQNVEGSTGELRNDTCDCTLSSTPAAGRAPLTPCENVPNELVIQVDKMGFVVPSSEQKENA